MSYRPLAFAALAPLALAACATTSGGDEIVLTSSNSNAEAAVAPSLPLMQDVVRRLSQDDFEGRAPSTAVEPKVLDYIIAKFKQAGLQPGNHGEWLQDVPTVEITGSNYTIDGGFAMAEQFDLNPVVQVGEGERAVPMARHPITFSATPARYTLPPPELDEHGAELRTWLAS